MILAKADIFLNRTNLRILHIMQRNLLLQRAESDHCSLAGHREEWTRDVAKSSSSLCVM
jgi:hypothetical protein